MTKEIAIINYGLGNVYNVARALEYLGCKATITKSIDTIKSSSHIILPGVGAYKEGMNQLNFTGLTDLLKSQANTGKPILGICLGMQLLLSESEEFGSTPGLDLISGNVKYFQKARNKEYKIPHMGWNKVDPAIENSPLLYGLNSESYFYFIHSLFVQPECQSKNIATTHYGNDHFSSIVGQDNIFGCQFHPERSGTAGLKLLNNFINL